MSLRSMRATVQPFLERDAPDLFITASPRISGLRLGATCFPAPPFDTLDGAYGTENRGEEQLGGAPWSGRSPSRSTAFVPASRNIGRRRSSIFRRNDGKNSTPDSPISARCGSRGGGKP